MTGLQTYRHHKGGLYIKLHEALHTETNEMMVVYACCITGGVFVRPKDMFYETISKDGYTGPRFAPVPDMNREQAKEFLKKGCTP